MGEIGYCLASFEAAIEYLKDIDLTEGTRDDLLSFSTVPLTEVSFIDEIKDSDYS